jgi:hypothetical protein
MAAESDLYDAFITHLPLPNRIPMRQRAHSARRQSTSVKLNRTAMTDILLENIKLVAFLALMGTILGLSHFDGGTPPQPKTHRKYAKLTAVGR